MQEISPFAQEYLDEIPSTNTTYFIKFTEAFHSNEYKYFALIEGNDKPYYLIPCNNIFGAKNTFFLRCDGKENVKELIITLRNSHTQIYREANYFGLVDKDYGLDEDHNFIPAERLYVTPCYSFENFYLSRNVFSAILESEFHTEAFGYFKQDYVNISCLFEQRLTEFINLIIPIDKKYRAHQISKKVFKESIPDYRSSYITLEPIEVDVDSVHLKPSKSLEDCFKSTKYDINSCLSVHSMQESKKYYQGNSIWEYCKIIRGKFLVKFLVDYLKKLRDDFDKNKDPICFVQRLELKGLGVLDKNLFYKCHLRVDSGNFHSTLAQYAEQPECLIKFLENIRDNAN